ncbi:MAG: M20/M25/M40 family metallo-hydrolase [candidate division Zixibacteria bacterium]|nr:M20/M25/M40 family metallo-hydrolase [candidate division Zixibacteria bacterium]
MKLRHHLASALVVLGLSLVITLPTVGAGTKNADIKALYDGEKAFSHIEELCDLGPRVAGGPVEAEAAQYIASEMESYGLDVEIHEFPMVYFEDFGSTLEVVDGPVLDPNTMVFSPSGEFTAEILACGLGYPGDFPPEVAGKIALIQRGELYFWEKTQNAAAAGALAAIIYNHSPGNFMGTLTFITDIPAVSISQEEGLILLDLLVAGPVTVYLKVDTVAYDSTSQNVIGTLEGLQPEQGIVYIGGHYDSVSAGPGANDDASGVAAMLEAARVLGTKGHRTKATLKFIAFGSEETGLDGSYNYVYDNYDEVTTMGIGMVNLDMVGVGDTCLIGNIGEQTGWAGSELREYTRDKADAWGLTWAPFWAGTNSDHAYFEYVGVTAVFLHQSPDPYYHTSEDTPEKIDFNKLEENGELATATLYEWAKNPSLRAKKAAKIKKFHVYHDKVRKAK